MVTIIVNNGQLSDGAISNNKEILSNLNLESSLSYANSIDKNAMWADRFEDEARSELSAIEEHHKNRDKAERILRDDSQDLNFLVDNRMNPLDNKMINTLYDVINNKGLFVPKDDEEAFALKRAGVSGYMNTIAGWERVTKSSRRSNDKGISEINHYVDKVRDFIVDRARRSLYRGDYYKVDWKAQQKTEPKEQQQRSKGLKM